MIGHVTVDKHWAVIERGPTPLPPGIFDIANCYSDRARVAHRRVLSPPAPLRRRLRLRAGRWRGVRVRRCRPVGFDGSPEHVGGDVVDRVAAATTEHEEHKQRRSRRRGAAAAASSASSSPAPSPRSPSPEPVQRPRWPFPSRSRSRPSAISSTSSVAWAREAVCSDTMGLSVGVRSSVFPICQAGETTRCELAAPAARIPDLPRRPGDGGAAARAPRSGRGSAAHGGLCAARRRNGAAPPTPCRRARSSFRAKVCRAPRSARCRPTVRRVGLAIGGTTHGG